MGSRASAPGGRSLPLARVRGGPSLLCTGLACLEVLCRHGMGQQDPGAWACGGQPSGRGHRPRRAASSPGALGPGSPSPHSSEMVRFSPQDWARLCVMAAGGQAGPGAGGSVTWGCDPGVGPGQRPRPCSLHGLPRGCRDPEAVTDGGPGCPGLMPGQALSASGPHCVWGRHWASAAQDHHTVSRRGESQAGPVLLFEKHKHGDSRDAAGALPGVQRGRGAGGHHEGPREGEGGQAERREWGPLPCPGGTPGARCWVGRCRQPPWFLATEQPEVCAGTALRSWLPGAGVTRVPSCRGRRAGGSGVPLPGPHLHVPPPSLCLALGPSRP